MEAISDAAFLVSERGEVRVTNALGRALKDDREVLSSLAAAASGAGARGCQVAAVRADGADWYLVVMSASSGAVTVASKVDRLARRWLLTTRQREVFELVAQGTSSASIATHLGISERTVEVHLTALFARAGVESRAALLVRVLEET